MIPISRLNPIAIAKGKEKTQGKSFTLVLSNSSLSL
jgi:hypothetical protein